TVALPALVTTSPRWTPALSAGPPDTTALIRAPPEVASVSDTLRYGWLTLPPLTSWSTEALTLLLEIAKPTPMLPDAWPEVAIAVLMPITSPDMFTSAPPEFPGLIAASVWIASLIERAPWP